MFSDLASASLRLLLPRFHCQEVQWSGLSLWNNGPLALIFFLPVASASRERARWNEFLVLISYPSGARKSFLFGQIINSLFEPSLSRQMAEYWPDSFLPFMDLDFVSVRKNAKRTRPISSHLDLTLSHCYYSMGCSSSRSGYLGWKVTIFTHSGIVQYRA